MALKLVESRPSTEEEKKRAQEVAADGEWLSNNSEEIWKKHKGKYIAVSKQTLFIGDSYEEAVQKAKNKYPHAELLIRHIPHKRRIWVL